MKTKFDKVPMRQLHNLIANGEDRIMKILFGYSIERQYSKYTSTLEEAWRVSIKGLSAPLLDLIEKTDQPAELGPGDNYAGDPVAAFGVLEARKHRERGVSLSMFLGLMKYYRQSYLDLIEEAGFDPAFEKHCLLFVNRFFDRVEIGFCAEWIALTETEKARELQDSNRRMTNEKNKFLTIFESFNDPVVFVNDEHLAENLNCAARLLLEQSGASPGSTYYGMRPAGDSATVGEGPRESFIQIFPWLEDEFNEFISGGLAHAEFESRGLVGKILRDFDVTFSHMLDISEKFTGTIVQLHDITKRKQAGEELSYAKRGLEALWKVARKSEASRDEITSAILDGIINVTGSEYGFYGSMDKDEKVLSVYSWTEVTFKDCAITEKQLEFHLAKAGLWGNAVRERRAVIVNDYKNLSSPDKKGIPEGHIDISNFLAVPIFQGDKIISVAAVANKRSDYTLADEEQIKAYMANVQILLDRIHLQREKEELQEQLLQSQKMETIGTLAGGIAHDFNNMLAVILGNTLLLKLGSATPDESLGEIEKSALRASDLTAKLLAFARKESLHIQIVPASYILNELLPIIKKGFPKNISIVIDVDKRPMPLNADINQLHQVFLNICNNACDAMPDGGALTIKAAPFTPDETFLKQNAEARPVPYCEFIFSDTGEGMIDEVAKRIFDPFFTTKEVGKGTGLGLSISHGIVKNHGGFIKVASKPGVGTEFRIYIPLATDNANPSEIKRTDNTLTGGNETILVVDDEKSILKLLEKTLSMAGYTVLAADSGKTAVEIYRKRQTDISLVLLDMLMPEMDGKDTFRALKEINPDIRAAIASGYSASGDVEQLLSEGARDFIPKPFHLVGLSQTIRRILDA